MNRKKAMNDEPLQTQLDWIGLRLSVVSNRYAYPLYAVIEHKFGLRRDEAAVIITVSNRNGPTAQDVVNYTARPKNSISRAVRKMESDGVLRREGDAKDARASRLYLTKKGGAAFRNIKTYFAQRDARMMKALANEERREFNRLLHKISSSSADWI